MAITFNSDDFESVRKLIDLALTSDLLPDSTLELDIYSGEAKRYVATRTSNADADAKRAAILTMAILVIPSVPHILSQSQAGFSFSRQQVKWEERTYQLEYSRDDAIRRSELANPTAVGIAFFADTEINSFDVVPANAAAL